MADDDLGNFFDEINQIEEVEEPKTVLVSENKNLKSVSDEILSGVNTGKQKTAASSATSFKQCGPQIVSKPAELVVNNRAVYTYGVTSTGEGPLVTSRDTSTEMGSINFVPDNSSSLPSSSSNKLASIGPSIGPIGPPTGPRPPSSSAPTPSYTSGGLNLSLHSFSTSYVTSTAPVAAPQMPKQDKTFVRTGAGEIWIDDSLKDWPENDYRIFVGDLGKETTTEMLAKLFQPYKSFAKAKVIRTKHDNKPRGFGFVSFMDPMDCAKAIREMQGKYLGTRPMKITRSKWDELDIKQVKKKEQKKRKLQESLGL